MKLALKDPLTIVLLFVLLVQVVATSFQVYDYLYPETWVCLPSDRCRKLPSGDWECASGSTCWTELR